MLENVDILCKCVDEFLLINKGIETSIGLMFSLHLSVRPTCRIPHHTIPLTFYYVWGYIIYYILVIYNTINTNERYDWGQTPVQFVIHKSIMSSKYWWGILQFYRQFLAIAVLHQQRWPYNSFPYINLSVITLQALFIGYRSFLSKLKE